MKKALFTLVVMFALIMNVNAQDIAMATNSDKADAILSVDTNDKELSPYIKKLKAEFMEAIKQQYFLDRDLEIPESLEIILMSEVYGRIYTYFTFDGKMSGASKDSIGRIFARGGFTKFIKTRHKDPKNIIYQK